jgi:hypothetical protein
MAKGNRTTSTARRATAAKATPSPTETICRLEDEASAEAIGNMADIDDMVDELNAAAKKAGGDDYHAKAHRQARAYKLVQPILTAAMQQQGEIEKQMTAFLASGPNLARHLARWQSEDAKI